MKKTYYIICLLIRVISGYYIFMQGYEKLTGGFSLKGLTQVIANNQDTPDWYKMFFENVIAPNTTLWEWVIPLGELMIGIALVIGFLEYYAALFGIFIMVNNLLADMIFTYPIQLVGFIIIALNIRGMRVISAKSIYKTFVKKKAG
ncbi:DoxX family protein [Mammaliicoccus sp. Dog046]|uniref:DoxX family protein n=1 Tax=Mammaliicoccus sp. Dog046 TaxID=3034233 RepID=UPI002B25E64F|nr:DoxX family protein [Mammaliicoccus sp. Dog046]WQK85185.1 DoxX family protein [Mammaliicoccus sp. Dog046]